MSLASDFPRIEMQQASPFCRRFADDIRGRRNQPDPDSGIAERSPPYHALSYVWGDPTPTATVDLDGSPLPIGSNLNGALLRLRQNGVVAWLWVDAICIDQNNHEERSWQAAQMRDIFAQASLVYIWLGADYNNSELVLDTTQRIGQDALDAGILDLWDDWPFRLDTGSENVGDDKALSFLAELLNDEALRCPDLSKAIMDLLGRANWFRSWITQELALPRTGLILCGSRHVSLDALDAALSAVYFAKVGRFARQLPKWRDFGAGLGNNAFHIRGLVARRQHRRGQGADLAEFLLADLRSAPDRPFYAATDARDVIFGLLDIAADTAHLQLCPDYSKTVAQVYTMATKAMIERWVEIYPISYRNYFRSSGDRLQPPVTDTNDPYGRILRRRGCLVDTVSAVLVIEPSNHGTVTLAAALASQDLISRTCVSILEFAEPNLKVGAPETALWRTLVGGWMGDTRCGSEFDALAPKAFRQEPVPVSSLTGEQLAYIFRNTYPYPLDSKQVTDSELQALVDAFCDRIVGNAASRSGGKTLFVTAGGKFRLGPENVMRDDAVTILFGTQVPIILRPSGECFTYLGDAYVDQVMDGEFMTGCPVEDDFDIM
ncbi:Putative heterokaryon incompatibility [Colletotrichum destructivum]|uniref:Heterokaryon incompatibility n=1 Tax=Colletotrichum destructivum TaxID=34406 RepID=A0AAX4IW95_9PEZI|nr:Putative heterokaryon incompatibility [Colletotrichum destructivum]